MQNISHILNLSKFQNYSQQIQVYLKNHFKDLENHGKGYGTSVNIHVYKDAAVKKCNSNLICYLVFHPRSSEIELRTINKTKTVTSAGLFSKLNVSAGTRYNLNTQLGTQGTASFDALIATMRLI